MGAEAGNREDKGIVGALDVPERTIRNQSTGSSSRRQLPSTVLEAVA